MADLEKLVISLFVPTTLCIQLLASVWTLRSVKSYPLRVRTRTSKWLMWIKLILLGCSLVASIVNSAISIYQSLFLNSRSFLFMEIVEPVTLALLMLLIFHNHRRSRRASTISLFFWPIYTIENLVWIRAMFLPDPTCPALSLYLRCIVMIPGIFSCVLESLGLEEPGIGENPILTANVYSRWLYGYMTPLMAKGAREYITEQDLPPLVPEDESAKLGVDLRKARSKYKSLWFALATAYGGPYFIAACLKVLHDCLAFLQPQLLRLLLAHITSYKNVRNIEGRNSDVVKGLLIVAAMFSAAVLQSIVLNQYFLRCYETGMRVRGGLITAIYDKALILSNDERRNRQTGDIVNLMSIDATRMQDLCTYGLMTFSGPFQITLALVSLYNLIGVATFAGVSVIALIIPLITLLASKLKRLNEVQLKYQDKRSRLMSELLANMKSIKMYAWEYAFMRRIMVVRNDLELENFKKMVYLISVGWALWTGIPLFVGFFSFATAALISSRPLTSEIIFPAISLFVLLQFPIAMFSEVTTNIIQSLVSVRRLSEFLAADELQVGARKFLEKTDLQIGDEVLRIQQGEFWWSNKATEPTLSDIDLSVKKGDLVGMLGRVGVGKTSLLSAIVGSMVKTKGEVLVTGSVAYASQDPWIMSASLRDNILFHHEYDETFYSVVLEACALKPDLEVLPQGDLTDVGEKGITLSGGQRARVSLARAVYARADLILLDDVLAAVDAHVARHLFDHVIGPDGLLSRKARVLSTNSVTFLDQFTEIIFLRQGAIVERGSLEDLFSNQESNIHNLTRGHRSRRSTLPLSSSESNGTNAVNQDGITPEAFVERVNEKSVAYGEAVRLSDDAAGERQSLSKNEHKEEGQVKFEVYMHYLKSASMRGFFLFVSVMIGQQGIILLGNMALRAWGEQNRIAGYNHYGYVLLFGLFSLVSALFGAAAVLLLVLFCTLRASKYFHDSALLSVVRSPLNFFEIIPAGRIMNIFSRDLYVVDNVLAQPISGVFRMGTVCLMVFAVIGFSFPPFLLVVPLIAWFFFRVMRYYLRTSRELKRLDAVSKSPIFAWFTESLAGVSTIRAFNQQSTFIANNQRFIDLNDMAYLSSITVNRWLAVRLQFVDASVILAASILAIIALLSTSVDAGLVGLVLSYSLNTSDSLNWLVRSISEVEQNIVSVERLLSYIRLPSEAPYEIEAAVDGAWPSRGEIEFCEYSVKYRPELELALKEISLVVKPREKIGVCGRTGAGKSSLLLAMLRIIEPTSGKILIDGVDITTIGLHDLRSRITIVPQSTELHSGSIREVVDPLQAYQDADIWVALGQANLKDFVESLPGSLDAIVSEGGSSLSSGQRQLLCFARALLRGSKIIVFDEATSAVDLETDRAIQSIIRGPQFQDVTMIVIAHRLETIMDSDRVLVLSEGRVAEFDTPAMLLAEPQSMFYALANEADLVAFV